VSVSGGPGSLLVSLATALEAAPDAVGLQRDGVVVLANARLAAMFGWPSTDAMVGTSVFEQIAPESRPLLTSYVELRRAGGLPPAVYNVRGRRRDGSTFALEIRATSIELDGASYSMAFMRDVTAQLAAAEALREREASYRALFEVNAAIKLLIDPADGRIVDANSAAAQFYGWSLTELRAMTIDQINAATTEEIAGQLERARSGPRRPFSFRHRTAGGALLDVEVYSGPVVIGGRTLLVSIIHDVTERNRFEEQLRRGQRLEAIGRLAAGIAHDFNNVLTVISASAQLAARITDPRRIADCLGDIRQAATRGATLTDRLLALGRAQPLTPLSVDLPPMLERVTETLRRVLGDPIVVRFEPADQIPRVRIDPGQLELALINLALNARDAMPKGGQLTIGVGPARTIPAGLEPGRYVALTVADTGQGMDDDTRARIFEPFFTTKLATGGTGLGLAVALGFLSQSGGTITVDSGSGRGACFTLYLPVESEAANALPPPPATTGRFAGTLVVVDDRDDVRLALQALLDELGFTVHAAASASAALATIATLPAPPALVLSDVTMPGGSGLELAAEVRATYPEIVVVLMSADIKAARRLPDGVGFLAKPFDAAELAALLAELAPQLVR